MGKLDNYQTVTLYEYFTVINYSIFLFNVASYFHLSASHTHRNIP